MTSPKEKQENWPDKLDFAPVIICPYTRYDMLQDVVNALKKNTLAKETVLFLFSDAPHCPEVTAAVQRVRDYLYSITGFKHVFIIERERNYGPINNYNAAIEQIMEKYERAIVMEDDIVTSPYYLQYMNDALEFYKDHPQVMAISSYKPPFKVKSLTEDVYFLQYFQPWGSAMWKKWRKQATSLNAKDVMQKLKSKSLIKRFNYYSSFIISNQRMLQMTVDQKINAHDILVSANILNNNGFTVFPRESMSNHIGFGDGVHCTVKTNDYISPLALRALKVNSTQVQENEDIARSFHNWLLKTHIKLLWKYLISLGPIKNYLKQKTKNKEF